MPFIRKRSTKAGSISSTLVESYRNEAGRPRLRVLANLHGEPDTLSALAKLAAQRADLRREKEALDKEMVEANQFYEIVTTSTLQGRKYDAAERQEIDRLMIARKRLLKRMAQVDAALAVIQRGGAVVKKHCSATPEEIQAAIQAYRERQHDAQCLVMGLEFAGKEQLKEAKATLRRLSR
jgi:hypothetical protein